MVWVQDAEAKQHTLQLVLVVIEFPDVFPDELLGIPPERVIEFSIDVPLNIQPIYIYPYRMAPVEFKFNGLVEGTSC